MLVRSSFLSTNEIFARNEFSHVWSSLKELQPILNATKTEAIHFTKTPLLSQLSSLL